MCRTSDAHSAEKSCSSEQNGDLFPQRTGSEQHEGTLRRKKKKENKEKKHSNFRRAAQRAVLCGNKSPFCSEELFFSPEWASDVLHINWKKSNVDFGSSIRGRAVLANGAASNEICGCFLV
ncbi:hypothetical protein CEXT_668401 [Caerostris extrusa]|uniref:Uncharacterized protein n=1 Tax=Caerostris extrusa TaxID=172846 RepID=A0AAV4UBC2_CAEEX|nr:hypothetical protein CEXT_668401 [Caerostris extrusa]